MNDPNWAQIVTAITGVFAAFGTVGAVIVALWQITRQGKRELDVRCSTCIIGAPGYPIRALSLRGTNVGFRPIKVAMAYLMTDTGHQVVSRLVSSVGDTLPKVILDGESVDVFWDADALDHVKTKEGFDGYLYAFFMDVQGGVFKAPFPGVRVKRRGIKRRRRFELPSGD